MRDIAVVISNDNEVITPYQTIDYIKEAGFKNVFIQWYDDSWDQQAQYNYAKEKGLNILAAHLGYQNIDDIWKEGEKGDLLIGRYKRNIDECQNLNIPLVYMHTSFYDDKFNLLGIRRLKEIINYAKEKEIIITIENLIPKGYQEYILDNIKEENLGICFDSGHMHCHYKDEYNFDEFKNKIYGVHLHDNDGTDDQHLLPFDGTINWEYIMEELKEANYNGPITLELIYWQENLKYTPKEFYKKGYEIGLELAKMIDKE